MARLWSSGFELNSLTDGVEVDNWFGTVSISSTTVRSGTYALRVNPTASFGEFIYQFGGTLTICFLRFYIRIATAPSTQADLVLLSGDAGSGIFKIQLNTDRTLRIYDQWNGSQVGSDSSVLSRSEEHTSELQSQSNLVCRLLL